MRLTSRHHAGDGGDVLIPGLRFRLERTQRENDARLEAKAEAKLGDLPAASKITDPDLLAGKRAVIEAALARARARR